MKFKVGHIPLFEPSSIAGDSSAIFEPCTDSCGCNIRKELISAVKSVGASSPTNVYAYQYDDIGNRISSFDLGANRTYTANALNQYLEISTSDAGLQTLEFDPQYDDDGNQTLIKTATGIWTVTYNGENRPVLWERTTSDTNTQNSNTQTLVSMQFDRMGRRVSYLETLGFVTNSYKVFTYDGYLQIANSELTTQTSQLFIWDPTEPVATRPLVFYNSNASPQYYTHDGNKNVSDLTDSTQSLTAHYSYTPFGTLLSSSGSSSPTNPFRFSSEYSDDTLGLVYYNYRHYNPEIGRWMQRDRLHEVNGYFFGESVNCFDLKGMKVLTWDDFTHVEDTSDFGHNARIHTTWNTSHGNVKIDIIRYHGEDCKDAMQVRRRDGMYEGFVDRKCPCDECAEAEISFPLFAITVIIDKHKSVVNKNRLDLSDDLYLQHEQIHLNISEGIALETQQLARKIKKRTKRYCNERWAAYFAKHDSELHKSAGKDIAKVFDQGYERKKYIDDLYDQETEHGTNYMKQKEWNKKWPIVE